MIVTQLDRITAYRVHTPKWASMPLSGAGAATHGGRVNRPGIEALYLALDVQTAIDEYKQVSTLLPPGTFVTYQISAAPIVDFREGFNAREWGPLWEDFYCDWRALWFNNRIEPPSWVLGRFGAQCRGQRRSFQFTPSLNGHQPCALPERV